MSLRPLPWLAILALVGCSSTTVVNNGGGDGGGSSSSSSGGSSSSSSGGSSATPDSGVWNYSDVKRTTDSCHIPQLRDPDGNFTLQAGAGGSFTITPGDGTDPFTCSASGGKFSCPDRAAQKEDLTSSGVNAVVVAHATASGDVVSSTKLSGKQDVQVSCTGTDCSKVAQTAGTTFPCAISITFTATKT
jgi:hypothetical protein